MMKKDTLIGTAICLAGVAYTLYLNLKVNKVVKVLDTTVDNIAYDIDVNIPERVINMAVEREVSIAAKRAASIASAQISNDTMSEISKVINGEFNLVSSKVKDEIATQIANIDHTAMYNSIRKSAEKKVVDKFDGSLDDLLEQHKRELNNVSRVYGSVADVIAAQPKMEVREKPYFVLR